MATSTTKIDVTTGRKAFVTLRFAGDDLDPAEISTILPVAPTRAHRKGEEFFAGPRAGRLRGRTGIWFLATDHLVASDDLAEHFAFIQKLLYPVPEDDRRVTKLRMVLERAHSCTHVTCFWRGKHHESAPKITSDFERAVGRLGITYIEIDFAVEQSEDRKVTGLYKAPGSVKTLKRYWKNTDRPDPVSLAAELMSESDRSAVVLSATILDDTLSRLISRRLSFQPSEKEVEHIFRTEGPLGAFSHRIEIAYLFGIIDDITYRQLHIVREMRNVCAHSMQPLDFGKSALVNVAKQFLRSGILPIPAETQDDVRLAFVTEFIILFTILSEGSRIQGIAKIGPALVQAIRGAASQQAEASSE